MADRRILKKMFRNKTHLFNAWRTMIDLAAHNDIAVREGTGGALDAAYERKTVAGHQRKTIWLPRGYTRDETNLCLFLHELGHHFRGVHFRNASQLRYRQKAPVSSNLAIYVHSAQVIADELNAWDWAITEVKNLTGFSSPDVMHYAAMRCCRTYLQSNAAEWFSTIRTVRANEELMSELQARSM
jgi:hypothetical protein